MDERSNPVSSIPVTKSSSLAMRTRTLFVLFLLTAVAAGFSAPPPSASSSLSGESSVSDMPGAEENPSAGLIQQMFFLKKMRPDVERIGLIWKRGAEGQEKKIKLANRAVATIEGKLYVGYVEDKSDVADKFRTLTREHDVQALWIIENDGVVNASAPREYLIKNTIKKGIPLLAPSRDWVDAGAPVAIAKEDGAVQILLNEAAANATALEVPEKYQSNTELIAAAN